LLRLHRWSGLAIALVVLCVGFTGALTTYQQEIDAWLNPDLLQVEPTAGAAASLDRVVEAAASNQPGFDVVGVRLPQASGDSVEVSVSPRSAKVFAGWYLYVDPHDVRVLGARPFDPDPWSRRGIVASLYEVHYSLAASRPGVWIVTVAAALWIATSLFGVWLAWPKSMHGWRRAQPGSAPYAIHRDAGRDLYVVRMREPGAIHRRGQTHVYVDARDATVLAVWNPRSGSAGDRFMSWQNPLHSGYAFGAVGRALVFLSGVAAVLCVVTGVPSWYARRRARTRR
jgi:uncharacterized iron-regulated membrane protein